MNINRNYKPFTKFALIICLAFLCSTNQIYSQIIFNVDSSEKDERVYKKSRVTKIRKQFPENIQLNKPMNVTGKVIKILSESSIIIKYNDRDIMVKFKEKEASNYKAGDNVSVSCVPYRENPNGVILSTGEKIEKSDGNIDSQTNSETTKELETLPVENRLNNSSRETVQVKRYSTGLKMHKTCTISGEITEIISDNNIIIKYDGREILVKFRGSEVANFEVGDKVSVTCLPYKINPNGIILAKGTQISKEQ